MPFLLRDGQSRGLAVLLPQSRDVPPQHGLDAGRVDLSSKFVPSLRTAKLLGSKTLLLVPGRPKEHTRDHTFLAARQAHASTVGSLVFLRSRP